LTIRVTGHQWWWEVQYQDPTPSQIVTTAAAIHIPVGRTVQFELRSADVIHSFWVPNLHGKRDLIPGHPTRIFLRADRPGTFRGQCAEYCGYQHAYMRFVVVAEPEGRFQDWLEAQRQPTADPATERQRRGQQVFLGTTCVLCHTIQGTPARGRVGPDLTHLGSRPLIGGLLPNTRGHLAGWIVDPQRIKPGVRMPLNVVNPGDLDALLDYLESLK
jgi:cytochrome c oxidase subunit 2